MSIPEWEMAVRIGAGIILGAAIGYEREHSGRPAGLRTHLLVSLASTLFMLVSTHFVYYQHYGKDDLVVIDTSRIAASVVTGVGFLGAGAIMRTGVSVQGLTTAASLWLVASVGLAAGAGMYLIAFIATGVTLFGLTVLRRVEGKQWRLFQRRVGITVQQAILSRRVLLEELHRLGVNVINADIECAIETQETTLQLHVRFLKPEALEHMLDHLEKRAGVVRIRVEQYGK